MTLAMLDRHDAKWQPGTGEDDPIEAAIGGENRDPPGEVTVFASKKPSKIKGE